VSIVLLGADWLQAAGACSVLAIADTQRQIQIVDENLACSPVFVGLLLSRPQNHLTALYALVSSPATTDSVFLAVYEQHRFGRFRFGPAIIDDLLSGLPAAVAACKGSFRCPDWARFILPGLATGGFFQCPQMQSMDSRNLSEIVPYADYECVEAIAPALIRVADTRAVSDLIRVSIAHPVT
jgi:hypothetical protein